MCCGDSYAWPKGFAPDKWAEADHSRPARKRTDLVHEGALTDDTVCEGQGDNHWISNLVVLKPTRISERDKDLPGLLAYVDVF